MKADQKELKMELRGESEIVFTRHFAAPRELVFDCHTKPELMRRWLTGPEGWSFEKCEVDLKVGGKYLYVWGHPVENRFGMHGVFREIAAPGKVVNTESFIPDLSAYDPNAPEDPGAAINSLSLVSKDTTTLMTLVCKYPSAEVRKTVLETGMVEGMAGSYSSLDKLILELV